MSFATQYSEIEPKRLRRRVRNLGVRYLSKYAGLFKHEEINENAYIKFIYIHHIFQDEELIFSKFLENILQDHTFLSYSDAIDKVLKAEIDGKYYCISSDDGFKNNLKAAEILNRYDIKGCFFVCPNIVGETNFTKIVDFSKNRLNIPPVEFMNWSDLELLKKQGHEIGSHTLNHFNLSKISTSEATIEICKSYEVINEYLGECKHFAWPYGHFSDFNKDLNDIVFKSGYESCSSAVRGTHVNGEILQANELCLRRDHIIFAWPLDQIKYLLRSSFKNSSPENSLFPETLL